MNYFGKTTNDSLSRNEVIQYALTKGIQGSYSGSKVSSTILQSSLRADFPMYLAMQRQNVETTHAIVAHGTKEGTNLVYIRNPWYQESEVWNFDTNSYVTLSGLRYSNFGYIRFQFR